jgi:hypothetical protein
LRRLDDRLWLHALRHLSFTELAKLYKDNPLAMHKITFHRRFDNTIKYIHLIEAEDKLRDFGKRT